MSIPLSSELATPLTRVAEGTSAASARVHELQARIHGMQRDHWEAPGRSLPGPLAGLLPNGVLRTGVAYTIDNSPSLVMALLGVASAEGAWCAVVGVPDFGAEAAAGFGIDLDRLILVPDPAEHWLSVTAALVDVLPVVVVRPPTVASTAEVSRLAARLRQTGCTLLVAGPWALTEATLHLTDSRWQGLGDGHGYLQSREVSVTTSGRNGSGRARPVRLILPEPAPAASVAGVARSATTRIPAVSA